VWGVASWWWPVADTTQLRSHSERPRGAQRRVRSSLVERRPTAATLLSSCAGSRGNATSTTAPGPAMTARSNLPRPSVAHSNQGPLQDVLLDNRPMCMAALGRPACPCTLGLQVCRGQRCPAFKNAGSKLLHRPRNQTKRRAVARWPWGGGQEGARGAGSCQAGRDCRTNTPSTQFGQATVLAAQTPQGALPGLVRQQGLAVGPAGLKAAVGHCEAGIGRRLEARV